MSTEVNEAETRSIAAGIPHILVIDDNREIFEDFRKVLAPGQGLGRQIDAMEAALFGIETNKSHPPPSFHLDWAGQGQDGARMLARAAEGGAPYALAFVDMRMPPGWDGIETIEELWKLQPELQVVICSAYSDHSWAEIASRLGTTDDLLILRKPFDNTEVLQIAHGLSRKWELRRLRERRMLENEAVVNERTKELAQAKRKLEEEMERRSVMEVELRLAQKLEAVGQLAAGIAHEINTPIQFVGDNLDFLARAFNDVEALLSRYRSTCRRALGDGPAASIEEELRRAEADTDMEFLAENVPQSIRSAVEGVARVSEIVRAMKEFAHPGGANGGGEEKSPVDLNRAIETTLVVARNEYKYVADVETDLGEVPQVYGLPGDLNQVFLNIIVNSAHAIQDAVGESGRRGRIRISTRAEEGWVRVAVTDTGCGIPPALSERIFDPFFTTKAVGRGTGQGLTISRRIVVDKHGGDLYVETTSGAGTTFVIRLPIGGERRPPETEATKERGREREREVRNASFLA
jgi:two-component system, NtrC family, sensor kinase